MHTLTAQDSKALRHADSIAFDRDREGNGFIRAIVRAENSSTGFEQTHRIAVESRLTNYQASNDFVLVTAFAYLSSARYDASARTLVKRMRPGKSVVLQWTRGNQSPVLDTAGLVCDMLHITIGTEGKQDAETYLVESRVSLDNSARMTIAHRTSDTRYAV